MINDLKVLGLILARGGSKGLPRKNLKLLRGKPLVAWSIETARDSKYLDDLVISTDDQEIADLAVNYNCEVPFLRPACLSTDTSPSIDSIQHALNFLGNQGRYFDIVALLEPTSPLRESIDIDNAINQLVNSNAYSIVGICRAETIHPAFMYRMTEERYLLPFMIKQSDRLRRQDIIDNLYFLEGTIYASKTQPLLKYRSFYHENTLGYEVPKWKSPEIDDEIDFLFVEAIMKYREIGQ